MSSGTLKPTTDAILEQCPRFRILLVGKSGVGKSSLINEAFSVDKATVSHLKSGVSDIEEEIISPENYRFVLHDSQGFEAGSKGNLDIVKKFVKSRSGNGVDIKEQVHAVWLCIQIPLAGGRVFETGDEEFLKFADQVNVPVIIVFTQYDELFRQTEENLTDEEMEMDIDEICLQKTTDGFKRLCLDPLSKFMPNAPYAKTSVKEGFRDTLKTLVTLTQELVERRVEGDVWIVSAMAQRTSARVKVDSSIAVGMKRYWQGLASSANFPGWTLEKCLSTIHTDIISCWNFYDPDDLLNSPYFQNKIKALMQLVIPDPSEVNVWFQGVEHIQSITSVVTALAAPLVPVIAAIGLSTMFISWVKSIYDRTPKVLRCLMSYITNLTLVMDQLFLDTLPLKPPRRLTEDIIDMTLEGYENSASFYPVHCAIREYVNESNWMEILRSNDAQEKVKKLIHNHLKPDS